MELFDLVLHEVQAEDALLELLGETPEERCLRSVLKQIECGHHRIRFFPGLDVIDHGVE